MSDEKELSPMEQAARDSGLAIPGEIDWSGWGKTEVGDDDLRTARIAIVQPTSDVVKEGRGVPGVFWHSALNRPLGTKGLYIPLGYFSGRMLIKDRKVMCRSYDRVKGEPENREEFIPRDRFGKETDMCPNCTMSKWIGRRQPPPCNVTYTYPVLWIDGDNYWTAFASFRGTANDAARIMNGDHMADNQPWHHWVYEAEPLRRENPKGWWFIWKVKRVRETTVQERAYAVEKGSELAARGEEFRREIETGESSEEIPL